MSEAGTQVGIARVRAGAGALAPFRSVDDAATVFSPLSEEVALVDGGILEAPMTELETRWRAAIAPVFGALDLPMPPAAGDPQRGRLDHGAAFRWLHGEFTMVRRSDPGATW